MALPRPVFHDMKVRGASGGDGSSSWRPVASGHFVQSLLRAAPPAARLTVSSVLVATAAVTGHPASSCPEVTGRWAEGPAQAVEYHGTTAYVGSGAVLLAVDLSTPSSPAIISKTTLPEKIESVMLRDGFAYVAAGPAGLRIIDLTTPTDPVEVGSATPAHVLAAAAANGHAYVGCADHTFRVLDISDPSNPIEVASHSTWAPFADIVVRDHLVYTAHDNSGLYVFDVSDPTDPAWFGFVGTPGDSTALALEGDMVFMADGRAGLTIIDVSDPGRPAVLANMDTWGQVMDVVAAGGVAFVAESSRGLRAIDVSDPANPQEIWEFDTPDRALSVAAGGGLVQVADRAGGLRVVSVAGPVAPVEIAVLETPGRASDLALAEGLAFVTETIESTTSLGTWGVRILDVSDPTAPESVAFAETLFPAYDVAAAGHLAYVLDGSYLKIFDVATPSDPQVMGDTLVHGSYVAASGGYAFVAAGATFRVVDVSDPMNPVEVGIYSPWFFHLEPRDLAVAGDHVYVASNNSGLNVFDVSIPSAPDWVFYSGGGPGCAVTAEGGIVTLLRCGGSVEVYDASTPSAPDLVSQISVPPSVTEAAAVGPTLYLSDPEAGLWIVDLSDPSLPQELDFVPITGALDVAVDGDTVVTLNDSTGIAVVGCSEVFSDSFESGSTAAWSNAVP